MTVRHSSTLSLQRCLWALEPAEQYLKTFTWYKAKYRMDKPLGEIIDTLQKVWHRKLIVHV